MAVAVDNLGGQLRRVGHTNDREGLRGTPLLSESFSFRGECARSKTPAAMAAGPARRLRARGIKVLEVERPERPAAKLAP